MTEQGLTPAKREPVKRLSHRHKRVLDFMVRNPEMRLQDVATAVGYTNAWVSTIVHSDLFQAEFDKRRAIFENQDNRALTAKIDKIAHEGLDQLFDHIALSVDDDDFDELDGPSFNEVKQVTELALKASGYLSGGNKAPTVNIQNNQTVQTPAVAASTLETARARIINGNADSSESSSQAPKAIEAGQKS